MAATVLMYNHAILHSWGLEKFLSMLEEKLGHLEEYEGPLFVKGDMKVYSRRVRRDTTT